MPLISVTEQHISKGYRFASLECPVALAIIEQHTLKFLRVFPSHILIDGVKYINKPKVLEFIENFDKGLAVKPIQFEL